MIVEEIPTNGAITEEPNQIHKALSLRHGADDRICVGIYQRNGDGEFQLQQNFLDSIDAAQQVIVNHYLLSDVGAIWSNLQRLHAGATARREETVEAYVNLLVDIDRRDKSRPLLDAKGEPVLDAKGKPKQERINATEAERDALLKVTRQIISFLIPYLGRGIMADSGNGYHLEWPTVPPSPAEGRELYPSVLAVLAHKFESPEANMQIDLSIGNYTRVITVWGTWNRKYPHEEERPQRQTKILSFPRTPRPLSANSIERVALENPIPAPVAKKKGKSGDLPEVDPDWLENYGPEHLCEWGMPYLPLVGSYEKGRRDALLLGQLHHHLPGGRRVSPASLRRQQTADRTDPWQDLGVRMLQRSVHDDDKRVILESIPEPFIGNPTTAKVVLLSLNPGHSQNDEKAHSNLDFRQAMMRNLRHEAQECPFYGLESEVRVDRLRNLAASTHAQIA